MLGRVSWPRRLPGGAVFGISSHGRRFPRRGGRSAAVVDGRSASCELDAAAWSCRFFRQLCSHVGTVTFMPTGISAVWLRVGGAAWLAGPGLGPAWPSGGPGLAPAWPQRRLGPSGGLAPAVAPAVAPACPIARNC